MNKELKQRLAEEYPFMAYQPQPSDDLFSNLFGSEDNEHGNGWFPLLLALAKRIAKTYSRENLSVDFQLSNTTESSGSLSVDYSFTSDNPVYDAVHESVSELVSFFETISENVCERCGRPGSYARSGTRCLKCREFERTGRCGPLSADIFDVNKLCGCPLLGTAGEYTYYGGVASNQPEDEDDEPEKQFFIFVQQDDSLVAEATIGGRGLKILRSILEDDETQAVMSAWKALKCRSLPPVAIEEIERCYNVPLDEILDLVKK